ncbi:MAG TPA: 4'-phosphopantetheinyl transferase superfamily protein [Bacilli bacterium]|nr:4'-phosphopantetheinyl transferase superfamily protein [Bacilli bacterium]HPS18848.1 4'-phosphopantetheinyl transferase superfamily protein [Bacilli bacterium]
MSICDVYISVFPFPCDDSIACLQRREEIDKCQNQDIKDQKFYVWKLLERALQHSFNLDVKNLAFEKRKNGKWVLNECYFSLSHSGNIAVVAVGDAPLGVDVQRIKEVKDAEKFKAIILSKKEKEKYQNLSEKQLLEMWSIKECAFKKSDDKNFVPSHYDIDSIDQCISINLESLSERYTLSLICDNISCVKYHQVLGRFKICKTNHSQLLPIHPLI